MRRKSRGTNVSSDRLGVASPSDRPAPIALAQTL